MTLPSALRALKHRNFRLFMSGNFVSLIGTWMQAIAESWLVYRMTGSTILLGAMGFASQIPVFLLAPIGGIVADRFNRHRIIVATQILSMLLAFGLSALTLTGAVQIWHLFVVAAMLGMVNAFDLPARQAFVVDMVGKADMMNAIALSSSIFNSSRIIGPAIAGLLVARIGEGWCFFVNGASYIAVIAGLVLIRMPNRPIGASTTNAISHILEGFHYVWRTAPIRALLLLLAAISLMGLPFTVLMPIFADQILHGGPGGLGLLTGFSGLGALAGALVLAARRDVRGLGSWVALSTGAFGIGVIVFAYSRTFWLSCAVMAVVGFFLMIEMGASSTLIQSMTSDRLRGRVMAVYSMGFMGMMPIGALLAGILAKQWGAPFTVAVGGGVCVLGAIWFGRKLPALRIEGRVLIDQQEMTIAGSESFGPPAAGIATGAVEPAREKYPGAG